MPKREFDTVFVLLVYKNTEDLRDFLRDNGGIPGNNRFIVVNNFCDEKSREEFMSICADSDCDYIDSDNVGYGAGNDLGIAYARENYEFRLLVVANPDTIIERLPEKFPDVGGRACVLGPAIRTLSGKRQNPCMVIYSPLRERLMRRFALRPSNTLPFYAAVAINKAEREIFGLLCGGRVKKVYSLHGSFMIFSRRALELMPEPFDRGMFLFREEDYLARLAKNAGAEMIYCPAISVIHKEDGSVRFVSGSVRRRTVESLRRYFGLPADNAPSGRCTVRRCAPSA
jgi:GT2 family glycosyltransferase